jgi:hypothetical protein
MRNIFTTVKTGLCILLLVAALAASFGGTANAAPNTSDIQKYCKNHLRDKIEDSVCTTKNINRIINAVEDKCKGKNQDACVKQKAQAIINKIAKKNPDTSQEFNDALDAALSAETPGGGCDGSECVSTPTGQGKNCDDTDCDLIGLYVNPAIDILSIIVGLVVTASLIAGGVQYITSSGDSQKTSAAKTRITNTLLAFLAYLFMYAFLNFLIPGGLF